jgi:hypothetical protein
MAYTGDAGQKNGMLHNKEVLCRIAVRITDYGDDVLKTSASHT